MDFLLWVDWIDSESTFEVQGELSGEIQTAFWQNAVSAVTPFLRLRRLPRAVGHVYNTNSEQSEPKKHHSRSQTAEIPQTNDQVAKPPNQCLRRRFYRLKCPIFALKHPPNPLGNVRIIPKTFKSAHYNPEYSQVLTMRQPGSEDFVCFFSWKHRSLDNSEASKFLSVLKTKVSKFYEILRPRKFLIFSKI